MKRLAVALVLLSVLAAPAAAQDAFDSHLEALRLIHLDEVAALNAATSAASLAQAELTTARAQITTLEGQVATCQTQISALNVQITTLTAEVARLNALLNQTPPPPPPPPTGADENLWASTTPASADFGDPFAYELGFKFRSSVAGVVKGVRFYKSTANTGSHVGHLWAASGGGALATVTFSGETANGWQQMLFSAPVSIAAGTLYIASVHMPAGHYAATTNYFTQARTVGSLTAVATSESGNGVYKSGASGFPSVSSPNAAHYWVDVIFSAGTVSNPPTTTDRLLSWTAPTLNADGTLCDDLAGFKLAWGEDLEALLPPVDVGMAVAATIEELPAGTWYAVVSAYDLRNNTSAPSAPVEFTTP